MVILSSAAGSCETEFAVRTVPPYGTIARAGLVLLLRMMEDEQDIDGPENER